jgi:hypothetical protein
MQFGSESVMRGLVLCLVTLCACADDAPPPPQAECAGEHYTPNVRPILLSQFPDRPFAIHVALGSLETSYTHRQDRQIEIVFEYTDSLFSLNPVPLHDGDISYCPEFDSSFSASMDGIEVWSTAGGWSCSGPGGAVCTFPHVTLPISSDDHTPNAVLTISDRSRTISVALGDSLLERTAAAGQPDLTLHANAQAMFAWSPSVDLDLYTGTPSGAFFIEAGDAHGLQIDNVTRTADGLVATLPDRVGAGTIGLELNRTEDYPMYSVTTSQVAFHDVSIVP